MWFGSSGWEGLHFCPLLEFSPLLWSRKGYYEWHKFAGLFKFINICTPYILYIYIRICRGCSNNTVSLQKKKRKTLRNKGWKKVLFKNINSFLIAQAFLLSVGSMWGEGEQDMLRWGYDLDVLITEVICEISVGLESSPRPHSLPCKVAFSFLGSSGNSERYGEGWERGQGTRPYGVVGLVFLGPGTR